MNIYFAGPDVFRPDYAEWRAYVEALCSNHGWTPVIPGGEEEPGASSRTIREANLARVEGADVVMANLSPFRGCEPDSGTVVEATVGHCHGKYVLGYIERPQPTLDRVQELWGPVTSHNDGWRRRDRDGWGIEDFGLPLNLMLHGFDVIPGGVANAIAHLALVMDQQISSLMPCPDCGGSLVANRVGVATELTCGECGQRVPLARVVSALATGSVLLRGDLSQRRDAFWEKR